MQSERGNTEKRGQTDMENSKFSKTKSYMLRGLA